MDGVATGTQAMFAAVKAPLVRLMDGQLARQQLLPGP
jgi:hypothetical protein